MSSGEGENVELVVTNAVVKGQPVLVNFGGLTATLFYLGRGHTDADLLVGSPCTLYMGDLVEQGVHRSSAGSFPEEWTETLHRIPALQHRYGAIIPGHGRPVSSQFVKTMANTMTAVRQGNPFRRHQGNPGAAVRPEAIPVVH